MRIFQGHQSSVQTLAYTPDGNTLVSGGDDGTVRVWDAQSVRLVKTLGPCEQAVQSVAVSPDGRVVLAGGFDKEPRLWGLETGEIITHSLRRVRIGITVVAFSPDGERMAVGADGAPVLQVQQWETGEEWHPQQDPGMTRVWSLAFSPDNTILALGFGQGRVSMMELATGLERFSLPHRAGVNAVSFSPDGTTLATLAGSEVRLWEVGTGAQRRSLPEHDDRAWCLAFTPDGRFLATGAWDSTVRLWDPVTGRERARFDWGLGRRVNALAFAPDGMTAAVAGDAPDIVVWDVDDF
jgi:WD40 repeat protein